MVSKNGIFDTILSQLVAKERVREGKNPLATACAIECQSVKKASFIRLDTCIDGNKNINGRKRNVVVDTLGLFRQFVNVSYFDIISQN